VNRLVVPALAAALATACGSDSGGPKDLLGKLNKLPGVHAEQMSTDTSGYDYYVLQFTQPVDHDAPDGPTFQQEVSLVHRDIDAPMVVLTSGYWDYYLDHTVELTNLLGANQISVEHRYFAGSRPDPADWTKLTIQQMATDEHVIIQALRTIYPGAFVTTGGSKGGMTAVYHRRFFPDDVDATVPYVAPLSFGAPDARYPAFLDTLGPETCRQAVRDAATEMLQNRRQAMLLRANQQPGHIYTRIPIGPAVESSIVSLEWAFWQYFGVSSCDSVPAKTATDDQMFDFLDLIAPIGDNDDGQLHLFEAYYYQAYVQLGYPDGGAAYLDPYLMYKDSDYDAALPTPVPTFDGGVAMHDVDDFVQHQGNRLLFVYGEWDPWTGGKFELGQATDSLRLIQQFGTHGSRIGRLSTADRDAALDRLAAWTGVQPNLSTLRVKSTGEPLSPAIAEPREPRLPSSFVRMRRSR
jgi:PS-10 peptidase S37